MAPRKTHPEFLEEMARAAAQTAAKCRASLDEMIERVDASEKAIAESRELLAKSDARLAPRD